MLRVLIAVALIQKNLGKPLEEGLAIPHDVEMIPIEEHGHHIITTASLDRIYIVDSEILLNDEYEGEIDDDDSIRRPDRAIDTAPCSTEGDDTNGGADCKDDLSDTDIKHETTEHSNIETTDHQNVEASEGQRAKESAETNKSEETDDGVETKEIAESKDTDDGVKTNEGKEPNESIEKYESVESNEVVLLNQTIRMNSSAIVDGKLTIVLHFEVQDDNTVEVVGSEIVDPTDVSNTHNETNEDDEFIRFSGPIHAHGKVCIAAHYGCGDDHTVQVDSSETIHPGEVSNEQNETDDDGVKDDDEDDNDDDEMVHVSGPVHAQGKVCVGAHYGCGGPPISMSFSRPFAHGHQIFHHSSEDDHEIQDDEDSFIHFHYRFPNIACQYHPSVGSYVPCRIPENHFDQHKDNHFDQHHDNQHDQDNHFDHHHTHHFDHDVEDHDQDYHFDRHHNHHFDHSHNHISDNHHDYHFDHDQDYHFDRHHRHFDHSQNHHQDHDFDHYHDKFDHSNEHQYEDFEKYFNRILGNSDNDSGEEGEFPVFFPFSGYVPASGSVKIAAKY